MEESYRAGAYEIQAEPFAMRRVGSSPGFRATVAYVIAVAAMISTGPLLLAFDFFGLLWGILSLCGLFAASLFVAMTFGLRPFFVRRPGSITVETNANGETLLRLDHLVVNASEVRDVVVQPLLPAAEGASTQFGTYVILPGRVVELDTVIAPEEALKLVMPLREALGMSPVPEPYAGTVVVPAAGCASVLLGVLEVLGGVGLLAASIDIHGPVSLSAAMLPPLAIVALDGVVHLVIRRMMGRSARAWVGTRFPAAFEGDPPMDWNVVGWALLLAGLSVTTVVLLVLSLGMTLFG
ncbi:MAG: hypothetical protein AAGA54_27780 [Myxococcota bacterium]